MDFGLTIHHGNATLTVSSLSWVSWYCNDLTLTLSDLDLLSYGTHFIFLLSSARRLLTEFHKRRQMQAAWLCSVVYDGWQFGFIESSFVELYHVQFVSVSPWLAVNTITLKMTLIVSSGGAYLTSLTHAPILSSVEYASVYCVDLSVFLTQLWVFFTVKWLFVRLWFYYEFSRVIYSFFHLIDMPLSVASLAWWSLRQS